VSERERLLGVLAARDRPYVGWDLSNERDYGVTRELVRVVNADGSVGWVDRSTLENAEVSDE